MKLIKPATLLGAVSCLLATSVAGIAHAQTSGEALSDQLEEVVVTAEKRETNLQKTAMSIQVYKGEELKEQGKKRIDDIMNGVVGVQAADSQVGKTFSIRGVDNGANGGPAGPPAPTVAVVIDGVYQNRSEVVRGGTLDVSQVEVMRGTQTTAVGANALAGAVSLVSNKPVFDYQASGSVEVGDYNLLNMEGVLNLPISGNQALRAAYSTNKRDGYLSSNAGNADLTNARLKYRIKPSDDLDIVLTASSNHIGGNGVSQGVLTYTGRWEPYNAANAGSYLTTMGGPAGNILFGLLPTPGKTFRDRSNPWDDGYPADVWPNNPYRDTRVNQFSAEINWSTPIGDVTVLPSVQAARFRSAEPPRGTGTSWMSEDDVQNTNQVEARLASRPGSAIEWLVGAYYYDMKQPKGTFLSVAYANDSMNACGGTETCYSWTDTRTENKTEAAFAQGKYSLTDALRLIGSLRYSHDTGAGQTTANTLGSITGPSTAFTYNPEIDGTWSATTFRAGIEYDIASQDMLYLTYATGYQPGAVDTMGNTTTLKSTTRQYTAGLKSRFLDDKLQFNIEGFLLKYANRPFTSSVTIGSYDFGMGAIGSPLVDADYTTLNPNVQITVPTQQSLGADVDITFVPTAEDRIDLSLEYLDATLGSAPAAPKFTVDQITAAAVANGGVVDTTAASSLLDQYNALVASYNGTTLQNAPKYSGNLTYQHRFSLASGASLSPSLNLAFKDKYWSQSGSPAPGAGVDVRTALDSGSILRQDAYFLWNAYLNWSSADGKYTLTGYVKNIANEVVQTNIGGEPGLAGVYYVSLDAPRTFGLTISASL
ncbi:MAG: TonB-dependent receptor [Steroidobacteraceae bacterium]